jgi:hypothetical protein
MAGENKLRRNDIAMSQQQKRYKLCIAYRCKARECAVFDATPLI